MFYKNISAVVTAALLSMQWNLTFAQTVGQMWTLESSIQQAMMASPELKKSMTKIGAYEADMQMTSLWPDPNIELRVDNKLGKADRSGGYDLTDITISQAIPVSRLSGQKSVAQANLHAAEYFKKQDELLVQTRISKTFYELQLASAELFLMEKRLSFANQMKNKTNKSAQGAVVRYLTPLEIMRLNVIQEEASQAVQNAEGKYHEALVEFTKLLGLTAETTISVSELLPVTNLTELVYLSKLQENHPQLAAQQLLLQASISEIEVARSNQTSDPVVSLSRSQDNFDSGNEDVYALMLNIQIPLQDRKSSAVSKANYKVSEQRIELQRLKHELEINLKRSHVHTNHIIEQAASYKQKVLKPANKILDLTNKGFISGELNILSLVDATNTYFDSQLLYLNLLYQAHVELAEIRLYAGQLLIDTSSQAAVNYTGAL